jgi:hypothetical protein
MDGWAIFWGCVASVVIGTLIKVGFVITDHYINVWLALFMGFALVFGGILIYVGVNE